MTSFTMKDGMTRVFLRAIVIMSTISTVLPAAINISSSTSNSSLPDSARKVSDSDIGTSYRRTVKSSAPQTNWLVGDVKPKTWKIEGWPAAGPSPSAISAPSATDFQSNLPIYPPYPPSTADAPAHEEPAHEEPAQEEPAQEKPVQNAEFAEQPTEQEGALQAQIECPEKSGLQAYAHPEECDQFYLCTNGTLTLERCQNGLLFKGGPGAVHNHCHYHWDVDCSVRHKDMVALSTESCEYQFGMYPEGPQESGCSTKYVVCEFGRANVAECAPGLAYDPRSHRCNWPDEMMDLNCEPKNLLGFECPEGIPEDPVSARFWPYPRFALKGDCKRLITCVNNQPRLVTCDEDMVVDDSTLTCEEPELVPNCAHFAKQIEEEDVQNK